MLESQGRLEVLASTTQAPTARLSSAKTILEKREGPVRSHAHSCRATSEDTGYVSAVGKKHVIDNHCRHSFAKLIRAGRGTRRCRCRGLKQQQTIPTLTKHIPSSNARSSLTPFAALSQPPLLLYRRFACRHCPERSALRCGAEGWDSATVVWDGLGHSGSMPVISAKPWQSLGRRAFVHVGAFLVPFRLLI